MSVYQCPVCGQQLIQGKTQWSCINNHHFDRAKSGYVNLLQSQRSKKRQHGDEKLMLNARRNFLNKGYYQVLADILKTVVHDFKILDLVDVGCGEGWYLAQLQGIASLYGLDISKEAIEMAARAYPEFSFCVGSSYHLPYKDAAFSGCLNVFAPYDPEEVSRILKEQGYFIHVYPLERHLYQLKAVLYDEVYLNTPELKESPTLKPMQTLAIQDTIHLPNSQDIHNLLTMTPYYHRTPRAGQEALARLETLTVDLAFGITIYRKETL